MGIDRIRRLREQLENLPVILESEVGNAVALHTNDIEELQREQLLSGRGKDGEKLEPRYRSGTYARKKAGMNSAPGNGTPDLKLTGEHHRNIQARAYASQFEISATGFKAKYLNPKYPNAIGLNVINVIRLQRELILPRLQQRLKTLVNP